MTRLDEVFDLVIAAGRGAKRVFWTCLLAGVTAFVISGSVTSWWLAIGLMLALHLAYFLIRPRRPAHRAKAPSPQVEQWYTEALAGARHALEYGLPTGPWVVFLAFWGPLAGRDPYPELEAPKPARSASETSPEQLEALITRRVEEVKDRARRALTCQTCGATTNKLLDGRCGPCYRRSEAQRAREAGRKAVWDPGSLPEAQRQAHRLERDMARVEAEVAEEVRRAQELIGKAPLGVQPISPPRRRRPPGG